MNNIKEKTNKKFMILSFFGIIMVVSGHLLNGNPINILAEYFPINSFFMPMFIFISGYFFKDEYLLDFKKFFIKKTKKLLLYYLAWNIIYAIIMKVLFKIGLTNINVSINLKSIFVHPFIDGQQFVLNAPAWFIPTLWTIEICYFFIRKISKKHIYNILTMILAALMTVLSVTIVQHNEIKSIYLPILKIMFFMFFYILGFNYKNYFERFDEKTNSIIIILVLMIINAIILKYNPDIHFSGLYSMSGFKNCNPIIPILTGITGIYFWVKISELLQESLKDNKIVNLLSNHTKDICMHHIFSMYCLSTIIYLLNFKFKFSLYEIESFKNKTGWYTYYFNNSRFSIIYFIFGIVISILIQYIIKKIYLIIKGRIKWKRLKLLNFLENR